MRERDRPRLGVGRRSIHWLWEVEARQPLRHNLVVGGLLAAWSVFLWHFVTGWGALLCAVPWVTVYLAVRVLGWRDGGRQRRAFERHMAQWQADSG